MEKQTKASNPFKTRKQSFPWGAVAIGVAVTITLQFAIDKARAYREEVRQAGFAQGFDEAVKVNRGIGCTDGAWMLYRDDVIDGKTYQTAVRLCEAREREREAQS